MKAASTVLAAREEKCTVLERGKGVIVAPAVELEDMFFLFHYRKKYIIELFAVIVFRLW